VVFYIDISIFLDENIVTGVINAGFEYIRQERDLKRAANRNIFQNNVYHDPFFFRG